MSELLHKKISAGFPLILLFFLSLALTSCLNDHDERLSDILRDEQKISATRFQKIMERGKLVAITDYNSTNYFIYRGEPMGYEFEKLKMFAEYLGVNLEIKINNDINEAFRSLEDQECDIIAMGLTITKERKDKVAFTNPHTRTKQVLVQRLPENWRKMRTWDDIERELIRNPLELDGKTVYIQKGSIFNDRLVYMSNELGGTIHIIEDDAREVEQLIEAVANGEIDYTIADEHVALVNEKYYKNIDVKTAVSFEQNLAWAVRKGSDSLLTVINNWLDDFNRSLTSNFIFDKYFNDSRSVYRARSEFHSMNGGKISRYDDLIKEVSAEYDLDWRLLASLIYQESQFHPDVKSWAGAFGLMQLMPATAAIYGVDSTSSEREQIVAGVRFLKSLDSQLPEEITDPGERLKFILAAYNVGIAHIFDARRLAGKHGKDPNVWTGNVDFFILNKSDPKYYRDDVVRYGYARGDETYNFVNEILDRYEHYKNVIEN